MEAGFPFEYSDYRIATCAGDMFMEIVDQTQGVTVARRPKSLEDSPVGNENFIFDVRDNCAEANDFPNLTLESIVLDPLTTTDQRVEVRRMAYQSYYAALQNAFALADLDEAGMQSFVDSTEDKWFEDLDPERSTGEALAKQMFASLSTIINEMKEIKLPPRATATS